MKTLGNLAKTNDLDTRVHPGYSLYSNLFESIIFYLLNNMGLVYQIFKGFSTYIWLLITMSGRSAVR